MAAGVTPGPQKPVARRRADGGPLSTSRTQAATASGVS